MFILSLLLEVLGYTTARLVLPIISLNRAYVQPVRSNQKGFNIFGCRLDDQGRLEVEATMAGWLGVGIWTILLVVVLFILRR